MNLDDYQKACESTAIYPRDFGILYTVLGVSNEAGELAGVYKKYIRDGYSPAELHDKLVKELGDVLWYAAMLATELGRPLSYVAEQNLAKLSDRASRGVLGGSGDNR